MPNAIKYSTTGDTLSIKKGNIFFGVGDVGKGPSSATTYYNGVTPSAGGYTIYSYNASQTSKLSFHSAADDAALRDYTNRVSGQSFATAAQCLNWYATQTDYVCVNRDYEGIVTSGLTFCLDAGFTPSYTTSGTTWYDLAYNGNNGTLTNGPTFSSDNGGTIVFDGVDDIINCGTSIGGGYLNITASVWVYPQRNDNYYFTRYLGGVNGWIILSYVTNGNRVFGVHGRESNQLYIANNTSIGFPNNNIWYHLCFTKNANNWRLYINGILEVNNNIGNGTTPFTSSGSDTLELGGLPGDLHTQGKISMAQIYDRALSASEVLQNFNAQKSRFGL